MWPCALFTHVLVVGALAPAIVAQRAVDRLVGPTMIHSGRPHRRRARYPPGGLGVDEHIRLIVLKSTRVRSITAAYAHAGCAKDALTRGERRSVRVWRVMTHSSITCSTPPIPQPCMMTPSLTSVVQYAFPIATASCINHGGPTKSC